MDKASYPRSQGKHTSAIDKLVSSVPGMQQRGFWAAVRGLADELDADIDEQPFRPDAYRINRATRRIEIHEVVVSHAPTERLLHMLGMFWFNWDSEGVGADDDWLPVLYVHSEGCTAQEHDLCFWYHHGMAKGCGRPVENLAAGFLFTTPEASAPIDRLNAGRAA